MKKQAAGLLVYRRKNGQIEILLGHWGGPFHADKDLGHWTIPKGEYDDNEDPKDAAKREFKEELNLEPPPGEWLDLGVFEQKNGKIVHNWAVEGDLDVSNIKSNTFKLEWPPRSGNIQEFPEIDEAGWFDTETAKNKIHPSQVEFLDRLVKKLKLPKHLR